MTSPRRSVPSRSSSNQLADLLARLQQGDLLSLGAVAIVGHGSSTVADTSGLRATGSELWSVTVDSELGWYVVISSACDIIRNPKVDPCIVVAPAMAVSHDRYQQLRSGIYSPREFPLPEKEVAAIIGTDASERIWPVADLRYVTSVEKESLLADDIDIRHPLTGPQQRLFSQWVGRRFNRPAHSDDHETYVLKKAGRKISSLAKAFARAAQPSAATPPQRLIGATQEWLIGGTDRHIVMYAVVTAQSAKTVGMYDSSERAIDADALSHAAKKLANELTLTVPQDAGYVLSVQPITLDGISAAEYLALDPWLWEDHADPLAEP